MKNIKRVQIQDFSQASQAWLPVGEVEILPDGRVQWSDRPAVTAFVRDWCWNEEFQRMVTIREPELYFETWMKAKLPNFLVVDLDGPDALPVSGDPVVSKLPSEIIPASEERGVEEPD